MAKILWFGNLLDWRYDRQAEMHTAWHGNRSHYIVKLDRQSADAKRTNPGWHLIQDDEYGQPDIGVHLGNDIATAKMNAETWIVCLEADMRQYPQLSRAMYSGSVDYDGLILNRDDTHQRFTVRLARVMQPFAAVRPVFLGRDGAVSIRWRTVALPAETLIVGSDSWAGAVKSLGTGAA